MDRIDDPRLRFYLERKAQIQEWAAIGKEERRAADQFLRSLSNDVEQELAGRGSDLVAFSGKYDGEAQVGVARAPWLGDGHRPRVSASIGWYPGSVTFADASATAWVGLSARIDGDHLHTRRAVHSALNGWDCPDGFKVYAPADRMWFGARYEPIGDTPDWDDLSGYRRRLVTSLFEVWDAAVPVFDAVLRNPEVQS